MMRSSKVILDDAAVSMRRRIVQSVIGTACLLTTGSAVLTFGSGGTPEISVPKALAALQSDEALYARRPFPATGDAGPSVSVAISTAAPARASAKPTPAIVATMPAAISQSEVDAMRTALFEQAPPQTEARIVLASADAAVTFPTTSPITAPPAPALSLQMTLTPDLTFDPTPDPRATRLIPMEPATVEPPKPLTPAEQLGLTGKERIKQERCLAQAIYFEARNEPVRGQVAVAQVVMNRVFSPYYPKDICSVVYQNAHRLLSCQFTFACDGQPEAINERGAWARAQRIAKQTLDAKVWLKDVAKSTHYHASYVRPNWVGEMRKMARYGLHTFYRPHYWGDGAKEAGWVTLAEVAKPEAKKKPTP